MVRAQWRGWRRGGRQRRKPACRREGKQNKVQLCLHRLKLGDGQRWLLLGAAAGPDAHQPPRISPSPRLLQLRQWQAHLPFRLAVLDAGRAEQSLLERGGGQLAQPVEGGRVGPCRVTVVVLEEQRAPRLGRRPRPRAVDQRLRRSETVVSLEDARASVERTSVKINKSPACMTGLTTRCESHVGRYGTLARWAADHSARERQRGAVGY